MKISEMTLEQLQDYAQQLENDKAVNAQTLAERDNEIKDLKDINLDLQKRNKSLFLQVEQQQAPQPKEEPKKAEEDEESYEDVVKNKLYKELINK